jgi:hypothetical protein
MPTFDLLYFDRMYRIDKRTTFDCDSRAMAIEVAERAAGRHTLELWQGDRFIHKVDARLRTG